MKKKGEWLGAIVLKWPPKKGQQAFDYIKGSCLGEGNVLAGHGNLIPLDCMHHNQLQEILS